ncbi:hypothetical protein GWN26_09515 [Candidatus Saccharibacteria bacterium]|nr:hypothetical protein [Candidatus Saccharibacteria bacterium]NIV03973.1 hypothetical protein [Calditrichia bacterium]NIV72336.1 hypothetical protein [Calditrichia bacterium]NIV99355.1 hypothetical protein [Candidatus Saccharibacteria bacterium]NIW79647.1 hypothetical protein [Calditrichia bacterium]
MDKVREIKQKYETEWMSIEGVVAVGIGLTAAGTPGVIVSVSKNKAEVETKIPEVVEGVPIEIQETGEIKAL